MIILDSSVWFDILFEGPLFAKCEKELKADVVAVPSLVYFEIYRKALQRLPEEDALNAVMALSQYETLDLTKEISFLAAEISAAHKLGMADSLMYAFAQNHNCQFITLDNDFAQLPLAKVLR